MSRFITFGDIEQFRHVIKEVQWQAQYRGKDNEGNDILDVTAKMPKVVAVGTEKIHGTNAAVCYSKPGGFWVQSRNNIITPEKDNAGCAAAVMKNKSAWDNIINELSAEWQIDLDNNIMAIYFEWCGGNIQSNAAVSGLNKMAIIFKHFKVAPIQVTEEPVVNRWFETKVRSKSIEDNFIFSEAKNSTAEWIESPEVGIFNIHNFPTVELEIDFERPDLAQNELVNLTSQVEKNSGVAKHFNVPENVGEGWVWTFVDQKGNLQRWKTKGDEHAKGAGKVTVLKPVDSVKEQNKIDFVNAHAIKEFRLEQAWQATFGIENEKMEPTIKMMGSFLGLVINDVAKEESDLMEKLNLKPKDVNSLISQVARAWFMTKLSFLQKA